uniref:Dynein regulatory complex protein 10 n=1 Tax=Haptolina ericina TaxID=156174 RepID=A0A7S3AUK7_9EUKA
MAILEETYHKLELLSHVPPLQLPNVDELRHSIGPEVLQVLEEQVMLEQQYKWVSAPAGEQKGGYEGEALPDFETLDDELRHSTRVVCRILREAPTIVERLEEQDSEPASMPILKFLSTFQELKEQTFQKLSTSVEEEKSKEDWFLEISAREEKASQTLRQLQKEIKLEKADRERQVTTRNETIQKLRDELEEIKTSTINETKTLQADTKAQEEADLTNFQAKDATLREELTRLKSELQQKKTENKESEEQLRKKKIREESGVLEWVKRYDSEMEEKDKEITALRSIYEDERQQLAKLEDYFNKLMAEREAVAVEERTKAEEQARQQAQLATLTKAATMLQKMWRGKVARREMERKKAGSRGKKGKKGKKGGKGKKKK